MLLKEAKEIREQIIQWRHDIHKIAEVGMETFETAKYVSNELTKMNISHQLIAGNSAVVATIGKGDKCILLRGDYDALPMKEEVDIEFKATNGNMHSCGHDLHGASLLGAAKILKAHEDELNGVVKFIFQPGEEIFKGAKACIDDGLLENPKVDCAFALHVNSQMPKNILSYGKTPMSSVYGFEIKLKGVGGHGSTPEMCVDPINTGVHIYLALQELVSRESSPLDEVALTIGSFNAGSVANIIPNEAVLKGTLRTFNPSASEMMIKRINEVVKGVAMTYRTEVELNVLSECPSVICDDAMNQLVIDSVRDLEWEVYDEIGKLNDFGLKAFQNPNVFYITDDMKAMASEDFAFITQQVPSSYCLLGAAYTDGRTLYGQHHPLVEFNDEALENASAIYSAVAMNYLK